MNMCYPSMKPHVRDVIVIQYLDFMKHRERFLTMNDKVTISNFEDTKSLIIALIVCFIYILFVCYLYLIVTLLMPYLYIQKYKASRLIEIKKAVHFEACCGEGAAAISFIDGVAKFNDDLQKWEPNPQKVAEHLLTKHDGEKQWMYVYIYIYI